MMAPRIQMKLDYEELTMLLTLFECLNLENVIISSSHRAVAVKLQAKIKGAHAELEKTLTVNVKSVQEMLKEKLKSFGNGTFDEPEGAVNG